MSHVIHINAYESYKANLQLCAVKLEEDIQKAKEMIEHRNVLEQKLLTGQVNETGQPFVDEKAEYTAAIRELYRQIKEQQDVVNGLMLRIASNPYTPYWVE